MGAICGCRCWTANNFLLDTQNLTSFVNGTYLVWKLTGHVKLQVTNLGAAIRY